MAPCWLVCASRIRSWIGEQPGGADGWVFRRSDYHLATPKIAALARSEHIYREKRFSDHAPLVIDYAFTL